MTVHIDERAVVGKNVELGNGVKISPFAVIEDNVTIGSGTSIGPNAFIGANTTLGSDCRIFNGASVGSIAQDLKYRDEDASLIIGDRTQIREFCTINKGTAENNGVTKIGSDCAFLAYNHVAHDCEIGDFFVSSNHLGLAGHVTVGDHVTCGGLVGVHQFVKIGSYSFLGAKTYITMDVVPYSLVGSDGINSYLASHNKIGLERQGFTKEEVSSIKKAFRFLFRKGLSIDEAKAEIASDLDQNDKILDLISFVDSSERGLLRMKK